VDRATGLICDQTVILSGYYSHKGFPVPLRRIKYIDPKTHKRLVFLTNQFALPALSIADLVSLPLAGRALLQVDQTAPPDQGILRDLRERGEDTNRDRHLGLCPRRHRQEAAELAAVAL
jgi:hypothetical protein